MKKRTKQIIGTFMTLLLTVLLLSVLTSVTERKASREKYRDFFTQKEDFDVLFLGTSHVINAIYPMELWKDYGIVSYNFGGHGSQIATTYWTLKNALDYTKPKLVVMDCLSLSSAKKGNDVFSFFHQAFDSFPLTYNKLSAIWDLLDDPGLDETIANGTARESDEPRTKIGLLWNFTVFHSRWNELTEEDFHVPREKEKGAESRIHVYSTSLRKIPSDQKSEGDSVGYRYLLKIIKLCKEKGIDLLLTFYPFPASMGQQMDANRTYDIAAEYGLNYINFLDLDIVDYKTDCFDESSHLNPSGARKVTDYIGSYIMSHYPAVADQRNNPDYAGWFDDYKEYEALKKENLQSQTKLDNYLMLLRDKNIDIIMEVNTPELWKTNLYGALLENLGVDLNTLPQDQDIYVLTKGGAGAEFYGRKALFDSTVNVPGLGSLSVRSPEAKDNDSADENKTEDTYGFWLDDKLLYEAQKSHNDVEDLRVTVLDSKTHEILDHVTFILALHETNGSYNVRVAQTNR